MRSEEMKAESERSEPTPLEESPEPIPDFEKTTYEWGTLWPLHYYIFGILFCLLLIYVCYNILTLITKNRQFDRFRIYMITNAMLLYFTFISAIWLLFDPYDSGENAKFKYRGLFFLFTNMRHPCITASLALIELSILEAVKFQLYSPRIQNLVFILSFISLHFIVTFILSCVAMFAVSPMTYLTICQIFSIIIGFVISTSSLHVALKVLYTYGKNRNDIEEHTMKKKSSDVPILEMKSLKTKKESKKSRNESLMWLKIANKSLENIQIRQVTIILTITALAGFLYWITSLYSILSYYVLNIDDPYYWQWFVIQTLYRLFEVAMISAMSFMVKANRKKNSSNV